MKHAAIDLLKVLSDQTRLAIINSLAKQDSYVEHLASVLSMAPATVCYHLKKMEQAGLVTTSRSQFYMIYSLNQKVFDRTLRELVICREQPLDANEKYSREVLTHFFQYGKLTSIPVQRKKREIILKKLLPLSFSISVPRVPAPCKNMITGYFLPLSYSCVYVFMYCIPFNSKTSISITIPHLYII